MHGDICGVVMAVALIFVCWTFSYLIKKNRIGGSFCTEFARKVVHIGVSNFAFIYLYVFDSDIIPVIGLLCFAVINIVIELRKHTRSYGTVEFPLSVAVMIALKSAGIGSKTDVACSLLAMGYGDGLAPFAGMIFKKPLFPFCKKKTLAGFICVFTVVFAVFCLMHGNMLFKGAFCALCAALCEVYTPFSLDNVSVPLVIYILEVFLV